MEFIVIWLIYYDVKCKNISNEYISICYLTTKLKWCISIVWDALMIGKSCYAFKKHSLIFKRLKDYKSPYYALHQRINFSFRLMHWYNKIFMGSTENKHLHLVTIKCKITSLVILKTTILCEFNFFFFSFLLWRTRIFQTYKTRDCHN